jgi:hypothetical protein
MKTKAILLFTLFIFTSIIAFGQPSESQLKAKVVAHYKSSKSIHSIEFSKARLEKRWKNDHWTYYWYRNYTLKSKTDYSGVYKILY